MSPTSRTALTLWHVVCKLQSVLVRSAVAGLFYSHFWMNELRVFSRYSLMTRTVTGEHPHTKAHKDDVYVVQN